MVSEDKKQELQALLSLLSDSQVEKLVTIMDAARSDQAVDASSELIMSMLRPSLQHTKPRRLQTPQRILCDPFEDLLVPPNRREKEVTKIPRTAIEPMWGWVQEIGGKPFKAICDSFVDATNRKSETLQWEAACAIWKEADKIMRPEINRAYEDGIYNAELSKRFGHSDFIDDIKEMLDLIQIGAIVESLKKDLPAKPILKMDANDAHLIKDKYMEAAEECPGSEAWLVISVMRRLLHEAEILKVVKSLSRKGTDTLASMTDLSMVGDLVISEVEGYVVMAGQIFERKGQELEVIEIAKNYMESFDEVTSNLDIKREGEWGQRMLATRKKIGVFITKSILNEGSETVMSGFTMTKRKVGNTISKVIDLRDAPDIEKYRTAERRAKAIQECRKLADRIGLKSATQAVVNEVIKELEQFEDKLIDILDRVAENERPIATKHVIMAARIKELLLSSEDADLFRKRALGILRRPITA